MSGMGTADDLEEFRACQQGYAGISALWNDLSRGAPLWINGPDENAQKMGINPLLSGERSEDEGLFVRQHEYWARTMRQALASEKNGCSAMTISYEAICAFLYREARLLDDRCWDEWLTCYSPEASYWMPAWDDNDLPTEDPQSEISLIYYPNRDGLEDRVFRIKTERSGASTPNRAPATTSPTWRSSNSVARRWMFAITSTP